MPWQREDGHRRREAIVATARANWSWKRTAAVVREPNELPTLSIFGPLSYDNELGPDRVERPHDPCDVQIRLSPPIQRLKSIHALRFWEFPCAAQDFGARAIESHHVIPARHSRQTIRNLAVAAAELNGDRAVHVFLGGDVIQRIGIVPVWLQIALGVVYGVCPEAVAGYSLAC